MMLMITWPMASVISVPPNSFGTVDTMVPFPDGDSISEAAIALQVRVSAHRMMAL